MSAETLKAEILKRKLQRNSGLLCSYWRSQLGDLATPFPISGDAVAAGEGT